MALNKNTTEELPFEIEGTADNQISFDDIDFETEVLTDEELEERKHQHWRITKCSTIKLHR
jgi:hypothetical protein